MRTTDGLHSAFVGAALDRVFTPARVLAYALGMKAIAAAIIAIGLCFAATGASADKDKIAGMNVNKCVNLQLDIDSNLTGWKTWRDMSRGYKRDADKFSSGLKRNPTAEEWDELKRMEAYAKDYLEKSDKHLLQAGQFATIYLARCAHLIDRD